jgi:hypothetical protein
VLNISPKGVIESVLSMFCRKSFGIGKLKIGRSLNRSKSSSGTKSHDLESVLCNIMLVSHSFFFFKQKMDAEGSPTATSIIYIKRNKKVQKEGGPNQNPQRKKKGVK